MQIRDNENKLGDNVKVSLLSDLPMQTSHILVMDRVDECVDENNALMSTPSALLGRSAERATAWWRRPGRINIFEIAAFAKWPRGPCGWVEGFAKGHPVALNALLQHEGEPPAGTAGTAQRGLNTVSASSDFQQCSLCL